jgi:predicted O-methyltransferase YrrM
MNALAQADHQVRASPRAVLDRAPDDGSVRDDEQRATDDAEASQDREPADERWGRRVHNRVATTSTKDLELHRHISEPVVRAGEQIGLPMPRQVVDGMASCFKLVCPEQVVAGILAEPPELARLVRRVVVREEDSHLRAPCLSVATMSSHRPEVDAILANPPRVHEASGPGGVWLTDRDCYDFLAGQVTDGSRTLETGLGVSTQLFAALGADHVCIVPSQVEVDALSQHCEKVGVDLAKVQFIVAASDVALPELARSGRRVDLAFIDGGHGFPTPILDWHYANLMLEPGGVCVFDDIQLPHVYEPLVRYLIDDVRWDVLVRTGKWIAVRKSAAVPDREEWNTQDFVHFVPTVEQAVKTLLRHIPGAQRMVRTARSLRKS